MSRCLFLEQQCIIVLFCSVLGARLVARAAATPAAAAAVLAAAAPAAMVAAAAAVAPVVAAPVAPGVTTAAMGVESDEELDSAEGPSTQL